MVRDSFVEDPEISEIFRQCSQQIGLSVSICCTSNKHLVQTTQEQKHIGHFERRSMFQQ